MQSCFPSHADNHRPISARKLAPYALILCTLDIMIASFCLPADFFLLLNSSLPGAGNSFCLCCATRERNRADGEKKGTADCIDMHAVNCLFRTKETAVKKKQPDYQDIFQTNKNFPSQVNRFFGRLIIPNILFNAHRLNRIALVCSSVAQEFLLLLCRDQHLAKEKHNQSKQYLFISIEKDCQLLRYCGRR